MLGTTSFHFDSLSSDRNEEQKQLSEIEKRNKRVRTKGNVRWWDIPAGVSNELKLECDSSSL